LKAANHIVVSSAETRRAFNSGFETGNMQRPTVAGGGDVHTGTVQRRAEQILDGLGRGVRASTTECKIESKT